MRVFLSTIAALALVAAAFGCTPPCNSAAVCAVNGQNENATVCDGKDYVSCTDKNRGQVISCVHQPEHAVCTPQGWTFEPTVSGSGQ